MTARGVLILTLLSNCALSLPVTSSQLENEDVKVMKCIVEALADVLSRPHSLSVSQECLVTLKTDDRLVTILRHQNFLKELQEIAVQGNQERATLHRDTVTPDPRTRATDATADRSMLEALGGPGERAILSQKKRTGPGDEETGTYATLRGGESGEENESAEEVKRENNEHLGSQVPESEDKWSKGTAEKRQEEEEEEEKESEEKRDDSEEDNRTKDKKGAGSEEKRDAPKKNPSKEKKFHKDNEEETDNRSAPSAQKLKKEDEDEEEERETKRVSRKKSLKQWSKRGESVQLKKKAAGKQAQEAPHHSKEVPDEKHEGEEKKKIDSHNSPEEKELRMIAQRAPEERRVSEEEGSASRKSEEPEIESLAAIESELENVAQKLHELRRG